MLPSAELCLPFALQVTVEVRDQESGEYSPVANGNSVLLRVYTLGMDRSSGAPGLAVNAGTNVWTLTFANMDINLDGSATTDDHIAALSTANYPTADYDSFRLSVAIVGIDNVENTAATYVEASPVS